MKNRDRMRYDGYIRRGNQVMPAEQTMGELLLLESKPDGCRVNKKWHTLGHITAYDLPRSRNEPTPVSSDEFRARDGLLKRERRSGDEGAL